MGADADDMIECPACHLTVRIQPRCEICGSPLPKGAAAVEGGFAPDPPDWAEAEAPMDPPPDRVEPADAAPPSRGGSPGADMQRPPYTAETLDEPSPPPSPERPAPDGEQRDAGGQAEPSPEALKPDASRQRRPPPPISRKPPAAEKLSANAISMRLFTDFDFKGRMARGAFWRMFAWRVGAALAGLMLILLDEDAQYGEAGALAVLAFVAVTVIGVSGLAEASRRLHDTGKPGLWNLLLLIPYVGFIPLLYLLAQDGQPHDNQYGPVPAVEA